MPRPDPQAKTIRLVGVDAGLLDDRRPFVDFRLEVLAQVPRGWRCVLRDRFGAQFGETLLHASGSFERRLQGHGRACR